MPNMNETSEAKTRNLKQNYYNLSILKRQLERGRDVLLRCQMSHVYMIIFLIILIFLLEIFFTYKKLRIYIQKYICSGIE